MKKVVLLAALVLTDGALGCAQGSPQIQQYGSGQDSGDSRSDGGDAAAAAQDSSGGGGDGAFAGDGARPGDGGPAGDGPALDTGTTNDSGPGLDSSTSTDGGSDGSTSGLDPGLVLPDPGGMPCSDPGQTQCTGAEICRISSTTGGTCEGCSGCGNLHAPCTADADCDILFQCYQGFCDSLCQLTTPQTCGVPTDCIDVGNATTGVCKYP